jgi:hypothetical protein
MIAAVVGVLALMQAPLGAQSAEARQFDLPNPDGGEPRTMIHVRDVRMAQPKICPKHKWEFDWITAGYGFDERAQGKGLRVRVYSQERKEERDPMIARMLMRLWDFNTQWLRIDHQPTSRMLVDVYVGWGGQPGGEHLFTEEQEGGRWHKANVIYIYAMDSFREPVEMAREVAHEYGHATLPAVGGFTEPEHWANGYLGEKLYLRWLSQELKIGRLHPADAMGATADVLGKWVEKNVDPLVLKAAQQGPDVALLRKGTAESMDHYMGLALFMESLYPKSVFARSMRLTGSSDAKDYPAAAALAAMEREDLMLRVPALLKGQSFWIPLGKGKLSGATVLKRNGDWAQIKPSGEGFAIEQPTPP